MRRLLFWLRISASHLAPFNDDSSKKIMTRIYEASRGFFSRPGITPLTLNFGFKFCR
jgi:hypothetical protein